MKEINVNTKGIRQRADEIDKLLSKLIKEMDRPHRRPIDSTVLPKFWK